MTTEQARQEAADAARAVRLEVYAAWLADAVDGLAHNLTHPTGRPLAQATAILAEAREAVALTLARIDHAIARDTAAHAEGA
jgi:hypothetical protein